MDMYNPISILGKGTFGTVHLCERIHNKQKIVVKVINSDLEGEQLRAAKNEVAILKSLSHPNIIQYFDNFTKGNTFYIVMEYATKGSLFDLISKSRPNYFQPQFVMDLFCQILMGLEHIHSKKVIHRDLKCENIFLTGVSDNVIKIGDFGISKKILTTKKTQTIIGTCNYLAPEVCDGKPYDVKSDIWSLGCILYELCALEKMFEGTLSNVVLSIANGKIKCVNTAFYGDEMQDLITMMLQVNPDHRPDTKALMCHPDIFPTLYLLGVNLGCLGETAANEYVAKNP
ncbi:unnamed protein product [Brassicogethes aeneus]|uniref:non-specific serine/threonine protein kinase n=1 Tax=Brassicogethes aeneus TaxID=1431903 RepID=A0A9P0B5B1_BRAAE|nr:unnamed protein product [Brassicogethes aeneus]